MAVPVREGTLSDTAGRQCAEDLLTDAGQSATGDDRTKTI